MLKVMPEVMLFKEGFYFRPPIRNIKSEAELIEILKAFKKEMRLIWFENISDQNSVLNRVYKAFKEDSDFILFDESKTKINIPELIEEMKRYEARASKKCYNCSSFGTIYLKGDGCHFCKEYENSNEVNEIKGTSPKLEERNGEGCDKFRNGYFQGEARPLEELIKEASK